MNWVREFAARAHGAPKEPAPGDWQRRLERGELDLTTYVCFVQAIGGPILIAWAGKPAARLSAIKSSNSEPVRALGVVRGGRALEDELHTLFAADRYHGEWYRASAKLATTIYELLSEPRLRTAAAPTEAQRAFVARLARC